MRSLGRLLALALLMTGTAALALWAGQLFGTIGLVIAGGIGLLVTANALRL